MQLEQMLLVRTKLGIVLLLSAVIILPFYLPKMYKENKDNRNHKLVILGMVCSIIFSAFLLVHQIFENFFPSLFEKDSLEKLFFISMGWLIITLILICYGGWQASEDKPGIRKIFKLCGIGFVGFLLLFGIAALL